ncbi:hypothetical protein SAMN05216419_102041 [Nitrosomonas cryotolerans]|uniref:Lipoprotein n=1 Tax=Nitrosomonas cryotolerans ATCC 49181 TaxID=1131553 RepID=A0A1N6H947_9PROT|nr:hypothetical protein [Nitrosomonas cryotolerans]SFP80025.1 hypothetical protein SAMN05216419_102041 [Nitrosomonas cryotolerans]SIO16270.1 hypothetical protein SAMN02743940_1081 [Nitrosomonas cryotolerans ATCC 49181]
MKVSLLATILVVLFLAACDRPKQALPEQEKENFKELMSEQNKE